MGEHLSAWLGLLLSLALLPIRVPFWILRSILPKAPPKSYETKKKELCDAIKQHRKEQVPIGLSKGSTNLFRMRSEGKKFRIDVRHFNRVVKVDVTNKIAEVEGMTTYDDLVAETLKYGLMPTVVPELKSITIGGAISGIGIESSSWKYGFVHETIVEAEVLEGDGEVVRCSPTQNSDLFYGLPNSYGTLGYLLKVSVKLIPVKKYVQLKHYRYNDIKHFFQAIDGFCRGESSEGEPIDFVDGSVFADDEMYITLGRFVDSAPYTSNYKRLKIYYHSIREKNTDYLTASDYLWRWDTDWFWCSRYFYAGNKLVRFVASLFGCLTSTFYMKVWRKYMQLGLHKLTSAKTEFVIQDVEIPVEHCPEFLAFFHKEIGIKPIWVCPVKTYKPNAEAHYPLYEMNPSTLYINFGFWDAVDSRTRSFNHANKRIEEEVTRLVGKKSLYSTAFYTEDEFWKLYNRKAYEALKRKYDSDGAFLSLYDKTVKNK